MHSIFLSYITKHVILTDQIYEKVYLFFCHVATKCFVLTESPLKMCSVVFTKELSLRKTQIVYCHYIFHALPLTIHHLIQPKIKLTMKNITFQNNYCMFNYCMFEMYFA